MKTIKISGEIGWETTARDVKWELSRASGDIRVEISSPGGSVFQGIEIFNAIKNYKGGQVEVVITSLAASIASYIALAGDTIKAHDNAVYMIHNAHVFVGGDHNKLRKSADIVSGLSRIIANKYIEVAGKSEKEIKKMMDEETFFYGEEMVEVGFVDSLIETEDEKDEAGAKAMAAESFKACLRDTNDRYEDADFKEAAALLDEVKNKVEEPKPVKKEGVTSEVEANAPRVNAINARLKMKEKSND
ncbi:MAG: head maturation protease, ClpP-related [Sulfurimonas sp.]